MYLFICGLYSRHFIFYYHTSFHGISGSRIRSFRRTLRVSSREYRILIRPDVSFLCALKRSLRIKHSSRASPLVPRTFWDFETRVCDVKNRKVWGSRWQRKRGGDVLEAILRGIDILRPFYRYDRIPNLDIINFSYICIMPETCTNLCSKTLFDICRRFIPNLL